MTTNLSPKFLCIRFNSGIAFRQGPHQVAQKSTRINLPCRFGSGLSHFSTINPGAFWLRNDFAQIFFSSAIPKATVSRSMATMIKCLFTDCSVDEDAERLECGDMSPLSQIFDPTPVLSLMSIPVKAAKGCRTPNAGARLVSSPSQG